MIPYELDPSLHSSAPSGDRLDDGFSPPVLAATHPADPEEPPPGSDTGAPNPTQLPVEPEFPPQIPPSVADDPHPPQPQP